MEILLVAVGLALGLGAAVVLLRPRGTQVAVGGDATVPLQHLAQTMKDIDGALGVLNQRVGGIERQSGAVQDRVQALQLGLERTGSTASGLEKATEAIRQELGQARQGVATLHSRTLAREELERRTAESLRRLEAVIAGTGSRGAAGENVLEHVFAQLPADWRVNDFTIGNRRCEFGFRLPNNLVLPIDSKWPATTLLDQFSEADDPVLRGQLKTQIQGVVINKAKEVTKYLDPALTASFGIAAVPDAAFELCGEAQVHAFRLNVVLLGYSMVVPYLLLVYQTVLRTSRDIDTEKLATQLDSIDRMLAELGEEIEGRLSRTVNQLTNSRNQLRSSVSRATGALIQARTMASIDVPSTPAEASEDDVVIGSAPPLPVY